MSNFVGRLRKSIRRSPTASPLTPVMAEDFVDDGSEFQAAEAREVRDDDPLEVMQARLLELDHENERLRGEIDAVEQKPTSMFYTKKNKRAELNRIQWELTAVREEQQTLTQTIAQSVLVRDVNRGALQHERDLRMLAAPTPEQLQRQLSAERRYAPAAARAAAPVSHYDADAAAAYEADIASAYDNHGGVAEEETPGFMSRLRGMLGRGYTKKTKGKGKKTIKRKTKRKI
jgi:hypothetical protein